jgi:hypothetical protein
VDGVATFTEASSTSVSESVRSVCPRNLTASKEPYQSSDELAPKDATEHLRRPGQTKSTPINEEHCITEWAFVLGHVSSVLRRDQMLR